MYFMEGFRLNIDDTIIYFNLTNLHNIWFKERLVTSFEVLY